MLTLGATAVPHLSAPEARQHPTAWRTNVGRTYLQSSEGGQPCDGAKFSYLMIIIVDLCGSGLSGRTLGGTCLRL